ILDSLTALSLAKYVKNVSHGYYIMDVIFAILGVIVGILLLISPVASALSVAFLVGIFFLVSGILMIVHSI
ncbi:DUF308 domain-containing protein, partial [Enterococcus lactis]